MGAVTQQGSIPKYTATSQYPEPSNFMSYFCFKHTASLPHKHKHTDYLERKAFLLIFPPGEADKALTIFVFSLLTFLPNVKQVLTEHKVGSQK
jgi:hypothetical protein